MYNKCRYVVHFLVFYITAFFLSSYTHAVLIESPGSDGAASEILGMVDPSEIAVTIYNILLPIGIAVGFFGIVMAGYSYLTSQGSPDKVKEASERLTSAILGIFFIVLSLVILRVIMNTLLGSNL
jgi:hypothetical protein